MSVASPAARPPTVITRLGWAAVAVMMLAACGGSSRSAGSAEGATTPDGFERRMATVVDATGTPCDLCLWVADTSALRSQGMMGVTDMGAADAMAFVYDDPTTGRFWMKDTPMPLSIAFFGADGSYLDAFDMEPCVAENSDDCRRYDTPAGFTVAVEAPRGGLPALGIAPGATLVLTEQVCDQALVPRID